MAEKIEIGNNAGRNYDSAFRGSRKEKETKEPGKKINPKNADK